MTSTQPTTLNGTPPRNLLDELAGSRVLRFPRPAVLYVHKPNGVIEAIGPATGIILTAGRLYVLRGEQILRALDREDVFFAARTITLPPAV